MRAVIIDDEVDARKSLKYYIEKYFPACVIVGEAIGVQSGIELINTTNPSVVFLDIEMKDGSGFDLLNQLSLRDFHLVFVTGYDEYAIKAFKYSAIDYLLKPLDIDDFQLLVNKLNSLLDSVDLKNRLEILEKQIADQSYDRIALPHKEGTQYIDVDKIINLESDGNYTIIETMDTSKIVVTRLLKDFEDMLDPSHFFRAHRSHIINIKHIDRFIKDDDLVLLTNDRMIPVSRRRKKELKEMLKK